MRSEKIQYKEDKLIVPDVPIIPYIRGDGIGIDIWPASQRVIDAAVEKAFDGKRKIDWKEILAGDRAFEATGEWLPKETFNAIKEHYVAIKGPLTTPVGGGIRSLNVTLRQVLDLYACVRPARWFKGVPSPVRHPEKLNVVIYRENTEDVYSGIEWEQGTPEVAKVINFFNKEMKTKIREDSGVGVKPISITGTKRLVRKAVQYAVDKKRRSVTLVHKGNIMKYTEGAFKDWGYELAVDEFRKNVLTEDELWDQVKAEDGVTPMTKPGAFKDLRSGKDAGDPGGRIVVKDRIADQMFQQVLTRPNEYDVIALPNLNGDYLSDAVAAQVGGLGMAPGGNIGDGVALFEATHGTAPKYAGKDKVNPCSLLLSGCMMLEYLGWDEAAEMIYKGIQNTIQAKTVTYDLERQMDGAKLLKCSEFATEIIKNMGKN